jgi:hypothetical protein
VTDGKRDWKKKKKKKKKKKPFLDHGALNKFPR